MTIRRALVALLALLGGCVDYCEGDTVSTGTFVRADSYGRQLTACIRDHHCEPLCADVFQIDGLVRTCTVTSAQRRDLSTQPAPLAPTTDIQSLRGINLVVTYTQRVVCSSSDDTSFGGDDGDDGDSGDWGDDGGDDGSCDDGSCDGGGDTGDDGGGDDGGGDDGGGDDGGGDDGGGDGGDFTAGGSAPHR